MVGQLKGMGTAWVPYNHHVKKGNMIGGDDGPGPEPIFLNSKL